MLAPTNPMQSLSPLQRRGMELRSSLDEALRLAPTPTQGGAAPPNPGPQPPVAQGPSAPPRMSLGGGAPFPQQFPSSPVMGALQQAQNERRPGMTPMQPLEVKRPAPPASYAQAAGPVGFARGGYVDLKVLR